MDDNFKYLTVSNLTKYLKNKFNQDSFLQNVYLKGEISNFKRHTSGHLYFTLKDETSKINAIMFANLASQLKFRIEDGMKVLVNGKISIYEPSGNYQIYINEILEDGVGNLYIALERLKKKLAKEGLFDAAHKKEIPRIPNRIGVVTAPTGAAIKDILSTLKRRFPIGEVILFPSLVQGPDASYDIVRQINRASDFDLDLLIVGRGGGSIEDLWAFNEEIVARAIYNFPGPVISAVGHEVDYTISDLVADVRAATPTGAAEIAVPNLVDLLKEIENLKIRANNYLINRMKNNKLILSRLMDSYILKNVNTLYQIKAQKVDDVIERFNHLIKMIIDEKRTALLSLKANYAINNPIMLYQTKEHQLNKNIEKLKILNPINTLNRGYAVIQKDKKVVLDLKRIKLNDRLKIILKGGFLKAKVLEIKEE